MLKILLILKVIKTYFKTFSLAKARFKWYSEETNVKAYDEDMLIAQLGYFGHHTEKALKHHNRGTRGKQKRKKLELLTREAERRNLREHQVTDWSKKLIDYFDNSDEIYIKRTDSIKTTPHINEILNLIRNRTTTRFWQAKEIDDKIIRDILFTAMHSSLSCNRQTIRFAIKKNTAKNIVIGDSNNQSMFKKAPVIIYVADDSRFFPEKYGNALDVGGVCALIQLAASAYGISGSWIYHSESYSQKKLKKELGFENYMYIYSSITLGYPLDEQEKPPRFSVDKFIVN